MIHSNFGSRCTCLKDTRNTVKSRTVDLEGKVKDIYYLAEVRWSNLMSLADL